MTNEERREKRRKARFDAWIKIMDRRALEAQRPAIPAPGVPLVTINQVSAPALACFEVITMRLIFPICLAMLVIALLFGCSSVGPTAEQLKEMANSQSSMCVTGAAWNGSPLTVHYTSFGGKSTGTAGGGGKVSCGASTAEFTNEGRMAPAPSTTAPATVVVPINVVPTLKVTP